MHLLESLHPLCNRGESTEAAHPTRQRRRLEVAPRRGSLLFLIWSTKVSHGAGTADNNGGAEVQGLKHRRLLLTAATGRSKGASERSQAEAKCVGVLSSNIPIFERKSKSKKSRRFENGMLEGAEIQFLHEITHESFLTAGVLRYIDSCTFISGSVWMWTQSNRLLTENIINCMNTLPGLMWRPHRARIYKRLHLTGSYLFHYLLINSFLLGIICVHQGKFPPSTSSLLLETF